MVKDIKFQIQRTYISTRNWEKCEDVLICVTNMRISYLLNASANYFSKRKLF